MALRLTDAMPAEVENRGRQHRRGMARDYTFDEMVQIADTAGRHHRDGHRIGDGAGQLEIEALFGAVAVHRGEQNLASAIFGHTPGPTEHVARSEARRGGRK